MIFWKSVRQLYRHYRPVEVADDLDDDFSSEPVYAELETVSVAAFDQEFEEEFEEEFAAATVFDFDFDVEFEPEFEQAQFSRPISSWQHPLLPSASRPGRTSNDARPAGLGATGRQ